MTFKYSLIIGILLVSVTMVSQGASKDLPSPDSVKGIGKSPPELNELTGLLRKKELLQFYRTAEEAHRGKYPNLDDRDSIGRYLWLCYYIASTPLFPFNDYDDNTRAVTYDNVDLMLKREAQDRFLTIARNELDQLVENHDFKRQELAALFCTYAARMLRDIRSSYEPNLAEKRKKAETRRENEMSQRQKNYDSSKRTSEEMYADIRESMRRSSNFNGKITLNGNRNSNIMPIVELMEWELLQTLVKLYPGKKSEVMKYIKLAGYENAAAYKLIDRTVGHDAQTEFLYKGKPKFPSNLGKELEE